MVGSLHYFLQVFNQKKITMRFNQHAYLAALCIVSKLQQSFGDKIHRCIFLLVFRKGVGKYSYVRTIKVLCQINKTFSVIKVFLSLLRISKVKSARGTKVNKVQAFLLHYHQCSVIVLLTEFLALC